MSKINRYLVIFGVLLFLPGCNRARPSINSTPTDFVLVESDNQGIEKSEIIRQEEIHDFTEITVPSAQVYIRKINEDSRIEIESVSVSTPDGETWYIGRRITEEFIEKANTIISTDLFGITFGPIDGFEDNLLRIGWNNRNRVLYIEVLSDKIKTKDGIALGDSKEKVLDILGIPYIEVVNEDVNQLRYDNTDFEVRGLLFQFDNDIVIKIYLFSYV